MAQNAINAIQMGRINVQTFTSSGTYTPTPGIRAATVILTGGGGGSGGVAVTGAGVVAVSANAGAGGVVFETYTSAQVSPSVSVTIGAGGVAGAIGGPGGNGGITIFLSSQATAGLSSLGGSATGASQRRAASTSGSGFGGIAIQAPQGQPRGAVTTSPQLPLWGKPALTITGFGNGGQGRINLQNSAGQTGEAGGSGQVTVIEYLGP